MVENQLEKNLERNMEHYIGNSRYMGGVYRLQLLGALERSCFLGGIGII